MKTFEEGTYIIRNYVEKAMKKYENSTSTSEHPGILEKLLKVDKDVAFVMAMDMLGAGIDTVSKID